jgi:hypothetical protein
MKNPKLLHHIALYGISLPTFTVSPSVAKATIYMPSHVAARMLGGRARPTRDTGNESRPAWHEPSPDTSHAA